MDDWLLRLRLSATAPRSCACFPTQVRRQALGGKSVDVNLKDVNTLTFATPPVAAGPQQLVVVNPDGESVSFDAAFLAQ
jgi:hypothetical protein